MAALWATHIIPSCNVLFKSNRQFHQEDGRSYQIKGCGLFDNTKTSSLSNAFACNTKAYLAFAATQRNSIEQVYSLCSGGFIATRRNVHARGK